MIGPRSPQRAAAAAAAHWSEQLLAELEQRIARELTALREAGVDPALQGLVVTDQEVASLIQRLRTAGTGPAAGSLLARVSALPGAEVVLALVRRFALGPFEADTLLACLASEIDRRFERLFAYLNDDLTRGRATPALLQRLLAPGESRLVVLAALSGDAPLQRFGLLQPEPGEMLRLADGTARWLLGRPGVDSRLARFIDDADHAPLAPALWQRRPQAAWLRDWAAARRPGAARLLHLHGRSGSGRRQLVADACAAAGRGLLALDGAKLRRAAGDVEALLVAALRDAHAADAVLMLQHLDAFADDSNRESLLRGVLQPWLRALGGCLVLASEDEMPVQAWFPAAEVSELHLPLPGLAEREADWACALEAAAVPGRAALAAPLAAKFRTTAGEVAGAVQQALQAARGAGAARSAAAWSARLHAAAARATAPRLHQLAEAMPTRHALDDLVLPADRMEMLHDLVRRVRHRRRVLEDWGFDTVSARGCGLVALFHGASGTGKTMAVDAIAHTLQMQLFRIDLAGVVSKYIGETEKNLRSIFDEAERADAVLFFDEADALFGKRSEVKDAHDRYANIEINYLLQRIESFDGIAVLATNKRSHLDEAFQRRIHVALEFPLPRQPERLQLWRRSFPAAAPLAHDIDWALLARSFELTGGVIRNAALGAAYLAAEAGGQIGNAELANALRTELHKAGRRVQDSEFGALAAHLAPREPRDRAAALTED